MDIWVSRFRGETVRFARVTPRERQVLHHFAAGADTGEIAIAISGNKKIVRQHLWRVIAGLRPETGVRNRTGLVLWLQHHVDLLTEGVTEIRADEHGPGCQCSAIRCTALRLAREDRAA